MTTHRQRRRARWTLFYQWCVYSLFLTLLLVSLALFFLKLTGAAPAIWRTYTMLYLRVALLHTWLVMILLLLGDIRRPTFPSSSWQRIAVIVPCYNESLELLERSLRSIRKARGRKEIILVDDGSTNGTGPAMRALAEELGITFHAFPENRGKRHALHYAVTRLIRKSRFVVMVDSDTVVHRDALVRITAPLLGKGIGATSGDIRLWNEDENTLTQMVGAYYWSALHIHRRSQSSLGMVGCCSGALSAYRLSVLRRVMHAFLHQQFLGLPCTHSEDRHLTNLVLQRGYDVVFVPEAVGYTKTPATFTQFLRQQQRWRRGFLQESVFTLSYAWRRKPLLFAEVLIWDITVPLLSVGIMFHLFLSILVDPASFVLFLLPSWIFLMIIRAMPMVFHERAKLPGLLAFMLFSTFVLYWQMLIALLTLRNRKWITR